MAGDEDRDEARASARPSTGAWVGGHSVTIDSFKIDDTYAGVMEGLPTINTIVDDAKRDLINAWGTRDGVLIIRPDGDGVTKDATKVITSLADGRRLAVKAPPYRCMAWLNSTWTRDRREDGSNAFVVWWCENAHSVAPNALVTQALATYDWKKISADFSW